MQKTKILFPFLLLLTACSGTKYLSSKKVKPAEISSLEFFKPLSAVIWIQQKDDGVYNDSLSLKAAAVIGESLFKLQGKIPALNAVKIDDSVMQYTIEKEMITAFKASSAYHSINVLPLPPSVDKVIESNGKRFGILVSYTGYARSTESYYWARKNERLNKVVNILTQTATERLLAGAIQADNAYGSEMDLRVMIVDSFDNKIIFYNAAHLKDIAPADPSVIANELSKLLLTYFK